MSDENKKSDAPVIEMADVAAGSWADPDHTVLTGINWRVEAGEYWVVAGMHDSGKRDLVSMAAGLTPPRAGSYRLFGSEMPLFTEDVLAQRLRLALVFDSGHLLRHLSVRENIALPLRYHRGFSADEIEQRIEAVLTLTGLADFQDVMPGALEHNWQKRAGLARALVLEPEVLIVDHPLGGLDLRHAHWWLCFLDRLSSGDIFKGRRVTLIVTAEDLRPWRNPECRFAMLAKQQLVVLGKRPELNKRSEPLVKELLAESIVGG